MKPRDFSATPNNITELSRCEIFVFGSNLKPKSVIRKSFLSFSNDRH